MICPYTWRDIASMWQWEDMLCISVNPACASKSDSGRPGDKGVLQVHMMELFQTSERVSIGSSDVTDITFVFKETVIEAGGTMLVDIYQGVSNAYVIRYKDDGELIPANECL
eukprot:scaffold254862_cov55-Attheya_sp.AAC.2